MTDTPIEFEPTQQNTRALRDAFGCFGTGVTLVTAMTADGPLGMTANSFSSISLDPALVLWSPAISSKRHDAFVTAPHFCIHILADDQMGLASHFASQGTNFETFSFDAGPTGAPRIKGCLAEFHCDTYQTHPAGDHTLILGHVRRVVHSASSSAGLAFHRGGFSSFAQKA